MTTTNFMNRGGGPRLLDEKTPALRKTAASNGEATMTPCTNSGVGVNGSMDRPGFGAIQPDFMTPVT
jgi:hypothetical protein